MGKRRGLRSDGPVSTVVLITQIGIGMMTPIALCAVGGYYLGRLLHAEAWVFILCMFVGIAVGYRNVWVMVRKYTKTDSEPAPEPETLSEAEEEFRRWKRERDEKNKQNGD